MILYAERYDTVHQSVKTAYLHIFILKKNQLENKNIIEYYANLDINYRTVSGRLEFQNK